MAPKHLVTVVLVVMGSTTLAACSSGTNSSSSTTTTRAKSSTHASTTSTTSTARTTTTGTGVTTSTGVTTTTVPSDRAILPPATTPPVVIECNVPLTHAQDGSFSPLTCNNGQQVNVPAWNASAATSPHLLALGAHATAAQANSAMCADLPGSTIPIEQNSYQIASLYYGWNLGITPNSIFTTLQNC